MKSALNGWLQFLPDWLRPWFLPGLGIAGMLALGTWGGDWARFFLFRHHLFYFFALMLLLKPALDAFWPSIVKTHPNRSAGRFRPARRRHRDAGPSRLPKQAPPGLIPSLPHRLASLRGEKATLDREIADLARERVPLSPSDRDPERPGA